jgi:starvation-inducible DNA-binding protein
MFQAQYEELFATVDALAERLRALGEKAPGSFAAFATMARVKGETGNPDALTMVKNLANDHETLAADADAVLKAAEEIGDDATGDLAIARIQAHQKTAWMLKAHLAA